MNYSKFGATKVKDGGLMFDSKLEHRRWNELVLLEKGKIISELRRQVPFGIEINGVKVCTYVADFVYHDTSKRMIVEDAKGFKTPEYKLKKKLMQAVHNITIKETVA